VLPVNPMTLHDSGRVLRGGEPLESARAALVLVHGRGATAEDIYSLGEEVSAGMEGVALLAPQAAGNAWYPQRFLAPLEQNEPFLSSALGVIADLVEQVADVGPGHGKVLVLGFSQGACLSLEFVSRHPRRYGGVVGLSGALIGPPGSQRIPNGSLAGTPVYLGCSDRDAHIPLASVEESAVILARQGARVTKSIFAGMGHTVNAEELSVVNRMVRELVAGV
jgi:predicted esterase